MHKSLFLKHDVCNHINLLSSKPSIHVFLYHTMLYFLLYVNVSICTSFIAMPRLFHCFIYCNNHFIFIILTEKNTNKIHKSQINVEVAQQKKKNFIKEKRRKEEKLFLFSENLKINFHSVFFSLVIILCKCFFFRLLIRSLFFIVHLKKSKNISKFSVISRA